MSSPGTGINWIVQPGGPPSSHALGKRDDASLKTSFPASPFNRDTPRLGVGIEGKLINTNVVEQANQFLANTVENDLFGGTVDLKYHHPDGPEALKPPNLLNPNQIGTDRTGKPIFMWAPNVASGDLNDGVQPESGIDASVRITDGQGAAFNAPPGGINPKATSEAISTTLRIGTLNFGKGSTT